MNYRMQIIKLLLFAILVTISSIGNSQDLFVAPNGNDAGTGSQKDPLFSAEKALKIASQLHTKSKNQHITIFFREGIYNIQKSIRLSDSLSNIKLQAYSGEKVTFFGGVNIQISQMQKISLPATTYISQREVYWVDLKKSGIANYGNIRNVGFARPYGPSWGEIFVNENEMYLSRWPNKTAIPMGKVLDAGSIPRSDDFANIGGIIQYDSLRISEWAKEKNVWMSGYFKWGYADDMVKIDEINTATQTLKTASSTLYGFGSGQPWNKWYGVNILAELDVDGEYYIDREGGILYFISSVSEIKSLHFSVLDSPFLVIDGSKNISVEGISFECSRDIGIAMSETENVVIKGCTFKNLGSLGITVGKGVEPFIDYRHEGTGMAKAGIVGSLQQHLYTNTTYNREGGKNNKIIDCKFYQLGAGGISLGGGNRLTLEVGNNTVENCVFYDINRIEKSYRPAVDLTGVGNRVRHCEIYNTPSMAIYMRGNNHLVEYNYIHDVCLEVEDQGAFYYGRDPSERGTIIRYNYFENIPDHFNTCAIYNDDGACGLVVDSNVFYKAGKWNVLLGGGSDNAYTNNIFIDTKFGIHVDNRLQTWSNWLLDEGGLFKKRLAVVDYLNAPYIDEYPILKTYFEKASLPTNNLIKDNVFVNVRELIDGKKEWLNYKEENWKTNQDIEFTDFDNRNFNLSSESKVFKKLPNFKDIPFHKIGLYESENIEY